MLFSFLPPTTTLPLPINVILLLLRLLFLLALPSPVHLCGQGKGGSCDHPKRTHATLSGIGPET
eukprot:5336356-Pyramimonas_sp.AAC.1